MKRNALIVLASVGLLAGCEGLKEAMTAHVDRVAQAGTQELSVTRLADLLGGSRVPLRRDVAKTLADIWVDYQLLAHAAAHGDSLSDPKVVDEAMWSQIAGARARKFYEHISKGWNTADTSNGEKRYNEGQLLAARHILFMAPKTEAPAKRDSVRAQLEALRPRVTGANFAQMAAQYTQEPRGKERGGDLGVFPKGMMLPEFQNAVLATQPGQVHGNIVETEYGYHLVYRPRFEEVREQFQARIGDVATASAESTFIANMEKGANIELKQGVAGKIRAVAADLDAHVKDDEVLATYKGGRFTSADLARWIAAYPPQANLPQQIAGAPDTLLPTLVKNFVRNQLVLRQADSLGVKLEPGELAQIRQGFTGGIAEAWSQLGIDPKTLADSGGRSVAERERFAAARIDEYLDKLLAQQARFVEIPKPVQLALRKKYEGEVNAAGLDRAVERAQKIRASADSTAAAREPRSAVPMPGSPAAPGGASGAPGAPPTGQQPPAPQPQPRRP